MKTIPPFKLTPVPLNEDSAALPPFKWAGGAIGTRHKLGGEPQFLQSPEWPSCRSCGGKMTFYGQLDSINDEFCIADAGMIYVFVCFDCSETHALIQSG